jgi:AAT family amino acid transporter
MLGFGIDELGWWGGEMPLYTALVGISGFTGTLCWVGILLSQVVFRKRLVKRGYDPDEVLKVKAAWYPWLEYFAIVLQVAAMIMLIFEDGGLDIFIMSVVIIVVPIVIYTAQKSRGKIRTIISIGADEVTFDEKFPDRTNPGGGRVG